MVEIYLGIEVHVFKEVMGSEECLRSCFARYAVPLVKQGAKAVGKRELQAVTEVGQDVLEGQNVSRSVKPPGGEVVRNFATQETRLFSVKRGVGAKEDEQNKVIYHLSRSKNWKTQDFHDGIQEDEDDDYDESESETSYETRDDIC